MTLKTEIEFELNETIAYTRSDERLGVFCPVCQTIVQMAVPHIAAILAKVSEREVYRLIVADEVHFIEAGRLLICTKSLINCVTRASCPPGQIPKAKVRDEKKS